jgi:hypothetical protein
VRALALFAALALGACDACTPAPAPPDAAPPSTGPTVEMVYGELVDAGCIAYDDAGDGLTAIAVEHASHDTPWLECLFLDAAATVVSCAAPCK